MPRVVIVIGDSGIGKSCLISTILAGVYSDEIPSTVSPFYYTKEITNSNGEEVTLNIWDTAGQERLNSVSSSFYRNAEIVLLCFCDDESFGHIDHWRSQLYEVADESCICVLVATKKDTFDENTSANFQVLGDNFVKENKVKSFISTSAKTGEGIQELLQFIGDVEIQKKNTAPSIDISGNDKENGNNPKKDICNC